MTRKSVPLQTLIEKYRTNPGVYLGMALETLETRLSRFLMEARVQQGRTVPDLAAELGLSSKTLAQLEAGKGLGNLNVATLHQWAHRLDLKLTLEMSKPQDDCV